MGLLVRRYAGTATAAVILVTGIALDLVVLSFDFPRTASLTLFFLIFGVAMGLVLLFRSYPDILPAVTGFLRRFRPYANATTYFTIAATLGVIGRCRGPPPGTICTWDI